MQVTLTPHAAELLRQAMARNPQKAPEAIIEQALAERSSEDATGLEAAAEQQPDALWQLLKTIPGIKLPRHWPPRFKHVTPIKVEGEPVSEQLIRERR